MKTHIMKDKTRCTELTQNAISQHSRKYLLHNHANQYKFIFPEIHMCHEGSALAHLCSTQVKKMRKITVPEILQNQRPTNLRNHACQNLQESQKSLRSWHKHKLFSVNLLLPQAPSSPKCASEIFMHTMSSRQTGSKYFNALRIRHKSGYVHRNCNLHCFSSLVARKIQKWGNPCLGKVHLHTCSALALIPRA